MEPATGNAGQDVNVAASSSANESNSNQAAIDAILGADDDSGDVNPGRPSRDVPGRSSAPAPSNTEADGSGEKPVAEDDRNKPVSDQQPKKRDAAHRIGKLTAKIKESDEQRRSVEVQAQRLKEDLSYKEQRIAALEEKLSQMGVMDERDIKYQKTANELMQVRRDQEYAAKVEQAREEARYEMEVAHHVAQFEDDLADTIEKFPTVDPEVLGVHWTRAVKDGIDVSMAQVAEAIYNRQAKHHEERTLQKYKDRINAPSPVSPSGTRAAKPGPMTKDEFIKYADSLIGGNW